MILRVTPHVDDKKQILLNIHPEVSTGTVDTAGIPSQTTTEVTTSLLVPNGETVFIGGLMKHTVSQAYRRVPVLGRVPVVKRLFSARERTQVNTETIVLITPRLVEDMGSGWSEDARQKIDDVEAELEADAKLLNENMDIEASSPDMLADFRWQPKKADTEPLAAAQSSPTTPEPVATPIAPEAASVQEATIAPEPAPVHESPREPSTAPSPVPTAQLPDPVIAALNEETSTTLYVVQIMSMSNRDRLVRYLNEVGASGLHIVRVEHDGNIFYSPVLGPYDSVTKARAAIDRLPPILRDKSPWVRNLSALQSAMARADELMSVAAAAP